MKALDQHIHECMSEPCNYPHCSSSKFIMSHFYSCCSLRCTSCQPVRELLKLPCRQKRKHDGEGDEVGSGCKRSHAESYFGNAIVRFEDCGSSKEKSLYDSFRGSPWGFHLIPPDPRDFEFSNFKLLSP